MMPENKNMSEESNRYLCFSLGEEKYAIPLLMVKEVVAETNTTPIPQSPPYFRGIMNLRGQIISIIDMKQKMKITSNKEKVSNEKSVIIVDFQSLFFGFVVDSVDRVAMWESKMLSDAPDTQGGSNVDYITGVAREESDLVILVDLKKMLGIEDINLARESDKKSA